ncbi:hypothetical protein BWI17_00695 [Betaproteobacteria bacterium GR16-43]|nr:hypothetical protein BWI17_00695 [Betaproteobacteria bacterium GR16-43]
MASMSSSVVAYAVFGHDNRSYFFERDVPWGVLCPQCKSVLNAAYRPSYLPVRTGMDISATYDNVKVVSERFVELCREHALEGASFHRFEGQNGPYYFIESDRVVPFDAERRSTRFENKCHECSNFESVVGATPPYLKLRAPVERGFHRTDLAFGSNQGKRPILVVDPETAALFKSLKLLGMDLEPVQGLSDAI